VRPEGSWRERALCAGCGGPLDPRLTCAGCGRVAPETRGLAFLGGQAPPPLEDRSTEGRQWARKARRPAWDLYAAYDPFNEAQRALLPLIPRLRERLAPRDRILDLSCRTGWSGALLAGLFPDAEVLSGWIGPRDVLGVRGYAWWLSEDLRPDNWDVAFFDPLAALPFQDDSFALVYGHDLVHHADPERFLAECLRVAAPNAPLVFPHVHLADAEPDPWFAREGTLRTQRDYEQLFARVLGPGQQGWVLSEKALLSAAVGVDPHQVVRRRHYNACLWVGPTAPAASRPARRPRAQDDRVLLNPLARLDPATGQAGPDPQAMAGGAGEMLARHPAHAARLESPPLDTVDRTLLFRAARFDTVAELAERAAIPVPEALERLQALERAELIRLAPVSAATARLQAYYRTQHVLPLPGTDTLTRLWQTRVQAHGGEPLWVGARDGSVFSYADADLVVRMAATLLRRLGVGPGTRVLAQSGMHPELPLLFWATALLGASFVPVSDALGADRLAGVVAQVQPVLTLLADLSRWPLPPGAALGFGDADGPLPSFAEACGACEPLGTLPPAAEDQEAAVLFTSASSGPPKGVRLSHGSLARSATALSDCFGLERSDRLLGTGGVHTMSGLRNACVAPLIEGASLLIPQDKDLASPAGVAGIAARWGATHVTTTPAWLAGCLRTGPRLKPLLQGLRAVLCTGAPLPRALRQGFTDAFGIAVLNYYGLTETGGICVGVRADQAQAQDPGIGRPVGALVEVRDDSGRPVAPGSCGLLWVYTDNRALGYLGDLPLPVDAHGWVRTGDRVRIGPEGWLALEGRADRLLLHHNGENIQPEEIEEALVEVGGFAQAYACSRRDGAGVDRIVALVAGSSPPSGWSQAVADRLSPAHVPERLVVVEALPLGPAGKVDPRAAQALLDQDSEALS